MVDPTWMCHAEACFTQRWSESGYSRRAEMAEMRHHSRQHQLEAHAPLLERRERAATSSSLHNSPSCSAPGTPQQQQQPQHQHHHPPPLHLLPTKVLLDGPSSHPLLYQTLLTLLAICLLLGAFSLPSLRDLIHPPPFLCKKDGILLRCPPVRETPSLWENPYSATTSWKPCAEKRSNGGSFLPAENETNGFLAIHAEGGLNQQRIAICNAVAVAKIMNVTLIIPLMKQDQIWKDQTRFEDIFDVDHFIDYLKDDVRIVKEIPSWFSHKQGLYTSLRLTVKNIPKYASAKFYLDNVLPRIREKRIMALKPFVDRLGYDNVPQEINILRCRVNYHALKFLPEVEEMANVLVARMRNRTGILHPYMALHLRFEKGMVGLSFCDFVGNRQGKALMDAYRQKEWPRRYKNGSHLWQQALQKRKMGRCPLEPGEVAVILMAMGYPKETQIYVASGQVYGGDKRLAPLRNMFPNLVTKEGLTTKEELAPFRKHVTSLAALDFLVCLKSDVFVMTHGGNFAKLIIGARRYMGHRQKSIKPNKGLMAKSLGDPTLGWPAFVEDVVVTHESRSGLPEPTFPVYDIYENPLSHCMCRT